MYLYNYLTLKKSAKLVAVIFASLFIFSACKKDEEENTPDFMAEESTFQYDLHNGQTVPSLPYIGTHNSDFNASMSLASMENGNTMITVTFNNTVDGAMYHMHAHDAADPSTTPNGTPYNETPNSDILVQMVTGNGGSVTVSQEANISYDELTTNYSGFFVVHDPLQAISTTDISTYLVVGAFARTQDNGNFASSTFEYDFNTGQLGTGTEYNGTHSNDLRATLEVHELAEGKSRVTVWLTNAVNGEIYHMHAHDAADPNTTPNGTPYNETPNGEVFIQMPQASNGMASTSQMSSLSHTDLTTNYAGFFVVHDPLQAVSTTDLQTYVIVGLFAR